MGSNFSVEMVYKRRRQIEISESLNLYVSKLDQLKHSARCDCRTDMSKFHRHKAILYLSVNRRAFLP